MRHSLTKNIFSIFVLFTVLIFLSAQKKSSIYQKGWIDFNKNGIMDVYENPAAPIDERVASVNNRQTIQRWFVEEAFTVMLGNSSTDVRLKEQFTIITN
jgi:hypothetical protein